MMIKFSIRIKELRVEGHLTQAQVAKEMGVTASTVTRWELGIQEPDYSTLARLADFYKVTTDYLLGLTND